MEMPESGVKSREISILKEFFKYDQSIIRLPRQDTGNSRECLILQGILKDGTEFYTDFTRFEGMIFLTDYYDRK